MSPQPTRHHSGVTIPEGAQASDLDWTAFYWDVLHPERVGGFFTGMQFILCPGVLLVRRCGASERAGLLTLTSKLHEYRHFEEAEEDDLLTVGTYLTQNMLELGYQWMCPPFMFDFASDASKYRVLKDFDHSNPGHPKAKTLGEAVRNGGPNVADRVFNDIMFPRARHLSDSY